MSAQKEVLEPGMELDLLVAEKVMGWAWFTASGISTLVPPIFHEQFFHDTTFKEHWKLGRNGAFIVECQHFDIPEFSSSWNDAWKVLAEMNRKGLDYKISSNLAAKMYWCEFSPMPQLGLFGMGGSRKSVSHAICIAALDMRNRMQASEGW